MAQKPSGTEWYGTIKTKGKSPTFALFVPVPHGRMRRYRDRWLPRRRHDHLCPNVVSALRKSNVPGKAAASPAPDSLCLLCQQGAGPHAANRRTIHLGRQLWEWRPIAAPRRAPLEKTGRGEPPCITQAGSKDFVGRYRSRQAAGSDWSMTEPCIARDPVFVASEAAVTEAAGLF